MGRRKYVNDRTADFRKVPIQDAKKAARVWGEGCKSLTELLEFCISNGIKTYACCKGHPDRGEPTYIYFEYQGEISTALLDSIKGEECFESVSIAKNGITRLPGFSMYSRFMEDDRRDEFFNNILKHLREYISEHRTVPEKPIVGVKDLTNTQREKTISPFETIFNLINGEDARKEIKYYPCSDSFNLSGTDVMLKSEQIEIDLPKLMGKTEMQKSNTLIETIKDVCEETKIGADEISEIARQIYRSIMGNEVVPDFMYGIEK